MVQNGPSTSRQQFDTNQVIVVKQEHTLGDSTLVNWYET